MRPFTDNDPRPLVLATAMVVRARARVGDLSRHAAMLGAGVFASRDVVAAATVRARLAASGSQCGSSCPSSSRGAWAPRPPRSSFGIIAKVATGAVPGLDQRHARQVRRAGQLLRQYFGVAFLLVATVVALLPASQIGATARGRDVGTLVQVLVQTGPPRVRVRRPARARGSAAVVLAGAARRGRRVARRGDARVSILGLARDARRRSQRRADRAARARHRRRRARGRRPLPRPAPSTASSSGRSSSIC